MFPEFGMEVRRDGVWEDEGKSGERLKVKLRGRERNERKMSSKKSVAASHSKGRPAPPAQVSQAQLKAQLNAVQKMLSAGVSQSAPFDWSAILASQPGLLEQVQSPAFASMAAQTNVLASPAPNMGFSKENYPPGLYFPYKFHSDYPPIMLNFFVVLWELLTTVKTVFPECKETPRIMKMLEENIHPDPRHLRIGISEYYEAMRPYFRHVERRDPSFLPHATELPFFDTMRLAEKLSDPDLDAVDIEQFMIRIERLNALSELYALVPKTVFEVIYQAAYSHLSQGPVQTPSVEIAAQMGQELLHKIPQRELTLLFEDKQRVMVIVNDFGKLKDMPGMMNLAPIAEQIMDLLAEPDML
jgi:hypothetical protein